VKKKRIDLKYILKSNIEDAAYQETLSAYGFRNPKGAVGSIRSMVGDQATYDYFSLSFPVLLEVISRSPDPDMALNNFERFVSAVPGKLQFFSALSRFPHLAQFLIKLFGTSQFLTDALVRNPEYLAWLADRDMLNTIKDAEALRLEIEDTVLVFGNYEARLNSLRRLKRREMLRIGIKDIIGAARLEETVIELSNLGDAVLWAAWRMAQDELQKKYGVPKEGDADAGFAVISMGKLGGRELNYSSDIDVMFVYSGDGETDPAGFEKAVRTSNREYFTKMGEMIIQIIGSATKEGYVFRIDTRLRPEGSTGPLVRSLDSYEEYYSAWGAAWERMALIKARFSAGDEVLGDAFIKMIQPFVYRKVLSQSAVDEIRDIKKRIEREVTKKGQTHSEVKLGYGGIREIEFTVQIIQLISAGKEPHIKTGTTLTAILAIADAGIFTKEEAFRLMDAYRFLRNVEHFIQIEHYLQIHALPEHSAEMTRLAKRLGYADSDTAKAGELLMKDFKGYTEFVHGVHARIFAGDEDETKNAELDFLHRKDADDEARGYFAKIGFKDTGRALGILKLLVQGPGYTHVSPETVRIFHHFAADLFACLAGSPDPDMAFNNFERFVTSQGARSVFYKMLDENRQLLRLLVALGGHSQYLCDIVFAHPDTLGEVLRSGVLERKKTAAEFRGELSAKTRGVSDLPEVMDQLRRYKKGEVVRIGVKDILSIAPLEDTLAEISSLADAFVTVIRELAGQSLRADYGDPMEDGRPARFAVFGMGKLGGAEIGYSSDLDIIFVYDGEGHTSGKKQITNQEYFAKLSEKIISILGASTGEGTLYRVDARLRPGGKSGFIVLSLDGYRRYYGERSMTWEKQSLTKARLICGDGALGAGFQQIVDAYLYAVPLTPQEAGEIRHMRGRMETERVKDHERGMHIKLGSGGIVDVEFVTQVLQLANGSTDPGVRLTNTLACLHRLNEKGYIRPGDFTVLHDGYLFLRRIENKIRIVSDLSLDTLPRDEQKLLVLVKRLGYCAGGELVKGFLDDYKGHTAKIREIFDRIVK
jgi:glutamate-ammonia-ligase adenylyltransferase